MLAAMINQPGFFDPTPGAPGYKPLVARWHYVLGNMVRDGALTQEQEGSPRTTRMMPADSRSSPRRAEQRLDRLPGLHHAGGRERARDQVRFTKHADLHPRAEDRHHVQPCRMMKASCTSRCAENKQAMRTGGVPLPGLRPHRGRCSRSRAPARSWPCTAGPTRRTAKSLPVQHGDAEPGPGRILVQALRAGHRGQAGHERQDQRPERLFGRCACRTTISRWFPLCERQATSPCPTSPAGTAGSTSQRRDRRSGQRRPRPRAVARTPPSVT